MYKYQYPRPAVTVDIMVFCEQNRQLYSLLIRRKNEPYKGTYAFPGGFVDEGEDLPDAAKRELYEETGLKITHIIPFRAYGTPGRDPRGHTVGAVFFAFIPEECPEVKGHDDAAEAQWISRSNIPILAFDHQDILLDLLDFLRKALYSEPLSSDFLASITDKEKRERIIKYFIKQEQEMNHV